MQISSIQTSNKYNQNFNARLILTGNIDDISKQTRRLWKKRVESIGTPNDYVRFHIENQIKVRMNSDGVEGERFAYCRNIRAFVKLNGMMLHHNRYKGYCVFKQPNSEKLTNKHIMRFLDRLGCKRVYKKQVHEH